MQAELDQVADSLAAAADAVGKPPGVQRRQIGGGHENDNPFCFQIICHDRNLGPERRRLQHGIDAHAQHVQPDNA